MKRRDVLIAGGASVAALGLGGLALAAAEFDEPRGLIMPPVAKRTRGILGQQAPALGVTTWFNLPSGKAAVDLADYKGKVVYLYFFQSWCPGCHKSGFPTLQKVSKHFGRAGDVAFLAVQTVFEGFGTNTAQARARDRQAVCADDARRPRPGARGEWLCGDAPLPIRGNALDGRRGQIGHCAFQRVSHPATGSDLVYREIAARLRRTI